MIAGYKVNHCPFCKTPQQHLHLRTKDPFYVRCSNCGAQGPHTDDQKSAVDKWNEAIDANTADHGGSMV